jgi:catechol 2,3-dioxygenase-like lactoylglutathione lyase family enzyme
MTESRPARRASDAPAGTHVRAVQHVSLPIPPSGIDAVVEFYEGLLGLRLKEPVPNDAPFPLYWMDVGATELHFFVEAGDATRRTNRHVCLLVDDVEALRRHLEAHGIETEDQDFDIPSRPRFFARDPHGNRLEFLSLREPEPPRAG